ncbi:MAG: alpha/beta fold hydrolase [Burkholderiales bacterium]|nr:alpha/beta fold hydrolase [Burkholderiales bacterium]
MKTTLDLRIFASARRLSAACLTALLPAAALASSPASTDLLQPPATLSLQGVPGLPASIAKGAKRYADLEGSRFVAWHPRERSMIVSQRAGGTHQLFLLSGPLVTPQQLTFHADPARAAQFEPVNARYLVVARDRGGNEAYRLYRVDIQAALKDGAKHEPALLSEADLKAEHWSFSPDGKHLLYATTTLDRNEREEDEDSPPANDTVNLVSAVHIVDPLNPAQRRTLQTLNGRRVAGLRHVNGGREIEIRASRNGRITTWRIDLAGRTLGEETRGATSAYEADGEQEMDEGDDRAGPSCWVVESDGEFRRLMLRSASASRQREVFLKDIDWDVERIAVPPRAALPMPMVINEAGVSRLKWFDRETRTLAADQPLGLEDGVIGALRWHRRLPLLALTHASARSPGDVHVYDAASGTLTRWTKAAALDSAHAGADPATFAQATLIRWKSFDGREITGFRYDPPPLSKRGTTQVSGPRPVLVILHGGPSGQSRPGFIGRNNYFINELGMTLIYPNVRGSTGFGRRFTNLDNGRNREDAVKDAGALLDWIGRQKDLDASKVIVTGGSYGGYMSNAIATRYPDRIAGSIATVGISHFVSLLERTESYRRDNRRQEYGDEREPAMREFLDSISPLTNAANIRKPILIAHGRNDPRVPHTEALQLTEKVRANGQPVWLVIGENEGHGFAKKDNSDFLFHTTIAFVQSLLKAPVTSQ